MHAVWMERGGQRFGLCRKFCSDGPPLLDLPQEVALPLEPKDGARATSAVNARVEGPPVTMGPDDPSAFLPEQGCQEQPQSFAPIRRRKRRPGPRLWLHQDTSSPRDTSLRMCREGDSTAGHGFAGKHGCCGKEPHRRHSAPEQRGTLNRCRSARRLTRPARSM